MTFLTVNTFKVQDQIKIVPELKRASSCVKNGLKLVPVNTGAFKVTPSQNIVKSERLKRLVSSVGSQVLLEIPTSAKLLHAHRALESLLSGMGTQMRRDKDQTIGLSTE